MVVQRSHSDIQLRFVRVDLESEVEVLITNKRFHPSALKGCTTYAGALKSIISV